ncbi:MAG: hypothetical protein RR835_07985 [Peptostreptococcaceae bacterium]
MHSNQSSFASIIDILNIVNETTRLISTTTHLNVPLSIISDDGSINEIIISNSKENYFSINNDSIIYKNKAINLNNIVKIKILTENISSDEYKSLLIKNLENITFYNYNNLHSKDVSSKKRYFGTFNDFSTRFNDVNNIQDYIVENIKNIKTINYHGSFNINPSDLIPNISLENVLNSSTKLNAHSKKVIEDVNLNIDTLNVISSIEKNNKSVLTNLETEEKLVLTNNSNEIEVSKPIITKEIDILTNLNVKNYNIPINQTNTKAIDKIIQNEVNSITNITTSYLENTLSNIDPSNQIVQTKTIEVLDLIPLNNFLDKNILDGKPLMLDPTGEKYIGIVLDDGTFEPLKLKLKTLTIIDKDVNNLLGNINTKTQLKPAVSDIKKEQSTVLKSLDINFNNNLVEYNNKNVVSLNDAITSTKDTINTITNKVETANVVSKNNYEIINNIKNFTNDNVEQICKIETTPVINSIEIVKNSERVLDNIKLDKEVSPVINNITSNKNTVSPNLSEDINGVIDYVGNGIMIVNNDDSNITIYSIPKISTLN